MVISNDGPPPAHLGDYPHGANWSADRPPAAEEDGPVDYSVSGPVIRFMWDYGVHVPLWDADALLPDEPQWLRQALQLSDSLIEDLTRWGPIFGHWWCASAHLSAAQAFNRAWSQWLRPRRANIENTATWRNKIEKKRIKMVSNPTWANTYQCP